MHALRYWLPLLAWLSFIFIFSTDIFASNETSRILEPFLRFLFPFLSAAQIYFWHGVIRKMGHVSEYFVLAVLTYRAAKYYLADPLKAKFLSLAFVLIVAMSDEFHQSFTIYRSASIFDVGYDGLGGLAALCLASVLRK